MTELPLAQSALGGTDLPVRMLAVVGGAVVGGFGLTWITNLIVRVMAGKKMPPFAVQALRLLGMAACGLLAYLWLFGPGGGGGWPYGSGGGVDSKGGQARIIENPSRDKEPDRKAEREKPAVKNGLGEKEVNTLRIEVLGNAPLARITGSETFDKERRYRVQGTRGLLTLEEVKRVVPQLLTKDPQLNRIEIVIYPDSPDRNSPSVRKLDEWARELDYVAKRKIRVDYLEPDKNAPVD